MNQGEIIFAVGALLGAIGSLWFIARKIPAHGASSEATTNRKLAIMVVLAVYAAMTFTATVIGIALQATGVAVIGALFCATAMVSLAFVWRSDLA
jgi:hypothetical protein